LEAKGKKQKTQVPMAWWGCSSMRHSASWVEWH
jgi:hypothetical protein